MGADAFKVQSCWEFLLGVIGQARLKRGINMIPDLRFGKSKKGNMEASFSVDAFFATMYHGVAETLPDRPGARNVPFIMNWIT